MSKSELAITVLPSESAAAEMLRVSKATLGRALKKHGFEAIPTDRAHYLNPVDVLELNETICKRVRTELAGDLVDLAWRRDPDRAAVVEALVVRWLSDRSGAQPEEYRTAESSASWAAGHPRAAFSVAGEVPPADAVWEPIGDD